MFLKVMVVLNVSTTYQAVEVYLHNKYVLDHLYRAVEDS